MIFAEDTTENDACVDPSLTEVAPLKPDPLMVTSVPVWPEVGVKLEILGGSGRVTVNDAVLRAVPIEFVTEIFPLVAELGTVAVIFVSELTLYDAAVPLNLTALVPVKPLPLIVTVVPGGPLDGTKLAIVGGWLAVEHDGNLNDPTRVCHGT